MENEVTVTLNWTDAIELEYFLDRGIEEVEYTLKHEADDTVYNNRKVTLEKIISIHARLQGAMRAAKLRR
jgi:hypothetical protein